MKNGRWVKIHEQGQANFETHDNVMDITVGASRCQAEATFTSRTTTYEKAAYWMLRYLGHADAQQILLLAAEEIQKQAAAAGKDTEQVDALGEGWSCTIEKMDKGVFRVQMTWATDAQPVTKTAKKRSPRKSKKTAEAAA